MRPSFRLIACSLLGISLALQGCYADDSSAAYGKKVKFAKAEKIKFPDFTLEYTGQHRQSSPKYPRGFLFYDFAASVEGRTVKFSWSSGTGDIGPIGFEINQKRFSLELEHSDKLGPLKDDEVVVWNL